METDEMPDFQYNDYKGSLFCPEMLQNGYISILGIKQRNSFLEDDKLASFQEFLAFDPCEHDNLAEEVIVERLKLQKVSLDQTIKLIIERANAKQKNIASLASEIMDLQSQLYVYRCHVYPIFPDNKRKSNLERALSELENLRRREEIECWKDTLKLWQELLRITAEYRATVRKARILLPAE